MKPRKGFIPICGKAVSIFRNDMMLTRHELAQRCNVTPQTIARIEREEQKSVMPRTFRALKRVLKVNTNELQRVPRPYARVIDIKRKR